MNFSSKLAALRAELPKGESISIGDASQCLKTLASNVDVCITTVNKEVNMLLSQDIEVGVHPLTTMLHLKDMQARNKAQKRWANKRGWEAAPASALWERGAILIPGKADAELAAEQYGLTALPAGVGKYKGELPMYAVGTPNECVLALCMDKDSPLGMLKALHRSQSPGYKPHAPLSLIARVAQTGHDGHTFISTDVAQKIAYAYGVVGDVKGFKLNSPDLKAVLVTDQCSAVAEYGYVDYREFDMYIDISCLKDTDLEVGDELILDFEDITLHATDDEAAVRSTKKRIGNQVLTWLTEGEYQRLCALGEKVNGTKLKKARMLLEAYLKADPKTFVATVQELFPSDWDQDTDNEGVEEAVYAVVNDMVERCQLGYYPRFHNMHERYAIEIVVEAAIRQSLGAVYVPGCHAWAITSSSLEAGQIRLPRAWKDMDHKGMLKRDPVHGRSSMQNVEVVGYTKGMWIECSVHDLTADMDGDSDGDLVSYIPTFQLDFEVHACDGGVKARAKNGGAEALEFNDVHHAAEETAKAQAQIGVAVDQAYIHMYNLNTAVDIDLATRMEASASIAAKDGACAAKWGAGIIESIREELIGKNYHSPYTALLKALCSKKHRIATVRLNEFGYENHGCVDYKYQDTARNMGRLAYLVRQMMAAETIPYPLMNVKHVQKVCAEILPVFKNYSPISMEELLKKSRPVYQQAAIMANEVGQSAAFTLAKAYHGWTPNPKDIDALRATLDACAYDVDELSYALSAVVQDPYVFMQGHYSKFNDRKKRAIFASMQFVAAMHDATDGKVGLVVAPEVDTDVPTQNGPFLGKRGNDYKVGLTILEKKAGLLHPTYAFMEYDIHTNVDRVEHMGYDLVTGLWVTDKQGAIKAQKVQF